jgi:hypothetical protein
VDATFHEQDETLELYALNRLSDSDTIRIEEHLLACDSCRDRLDQNAGFAIAVREDLKSHPVHAAWAPPSWFAPLLRPQFAFAGALAMALLAVLIVWNNQTRLAPVASLQFNAMRGNDAASVQPARELDLTLTDAVTSGAPVVEIVSGVGAEIWKGTPEMSGKVARAKIVKTLPEGDYLVRFYDSPGHLLHEYSFRVERR